MATRFGALDHQRVRTGTNKPLGQHERGREGDQLGAAILHRAHRVARRNAAGQYDMAHTSFDADAYQIIQMRMHGDQVHAERHFGQRLGGGDFGRQHIRHHAAAGNHAKPAGVADGGYEVAFGNPAHGAAHDGGARAQEGAAARPKIVQPRAGRRVQQHGFGN